MVHAAKSVLRLVARKLRVGTPVSFATNVLMPTGLYGTLLGAYLGTVILKAVLTELTQEMEAQEVTDIMGQHGVTGVEKLAALAGRGVMNEVEDSVSCPHAHHEHHDDSAHHGHDEQKEHQQHAEHHEHHNHHDHHGHQHHDKQHDYQQHQEHHDHHEPYDDSAHHDDSDHEAVGGGVEESIGEPSSHNPRQQPGPPHRSLQQVVLAEVAEVQQRKLRNRNRYENGCNADNAKQSQPAPEVAEYDAQNTQPMPEGPVVDHADAPLGDTEIPSNSKQRAHDMEADDAHGTASAQHKTSGADWEFSFPSLTSSPHHQNGLCHHNTGLHCNTSIGSHALPDITESADQHAASSFHAVKADPAPLPSSPISIMDGDDVPFGDAHDQQTAASAEPAAWNRSLAVK